MMEPRNYYRSAKTGGLGCAFYIMLSFILAPPRLIILLIQLAIKKISGKSDSETSDANTEGGLS